MILAKIFIVTLWSLFSSIGNVKGSFSSMDISIQTNGWAPPMTLRQNEPYISFMNYNKQPTWQSKNRTSLVDEVQEIYLPNNFPIQIFCGVCFNIGDSVIPTAKDIYVSIFLKDGHDELHAIDQVEGKFSHFQFNHNSCYTIFRATKTPVNNHNHDTGFMKCGFDNYFSVLNFKIKEPTYISIRDMKNNFLQFPCCHEDGDITMNVMTIGVMNETGYFVGVEQERNEFHAKVNHRFFTDANCSMYTFLKENEMSLRHYRYHHSSTTSLMDTATTGMKKIYYSSSMGINHSTTISSYSNDIISTTNFPIVDDKISKTKAIKDTKDGDAKENTSTTDTIDITTVMDSTTENFVHASGSALSCFCVIVTLLIFVIHLYISDICCVGGM